MSPIPTGHRFQAGPLDRVKAVLFDIYGTLLVSGTGDIGLAAQNGAIPDRSSILTDILNDAGLKEINIPELLDRSIADQHSQSRAKGIDYPEVDIRIVWKSVLERTGASPQGLTAEEIALRWELAVNPVWPMPGFPAILPTLKRRALRLGIVSNAQFYTPLILEALTGQSLNELGFEPDLCVWSYREGRAKPSPAMFSGALKQLRFLGIRPDQVLYVGNDMLNDVTAASQAGCRTALFAGDKRSLRLRENDPRVSVQPDMVLTELEQISTLINQAVIA